MARLRIREWASRGRRAPPSAPPSALVVAFPTLDDAVGGLRRRLDPSARHGMPAHVTVLFPFAASASRDPAVVARLAGVFAATAPFAVTFGRIDWFGTRVLYLVPEPAGPFEALTRAVTEAFPAFPPYEGAFATVVPHCTVGEDAPLRRLRRAARVVERQLPLEADVASVTLMEHDGATGWLPTHTFALGRS